MGLSRLLCAFEVIYFVAIRVHKHKKKSQMDNFVINISSHKVTILASKSVVQLGLFLFPISLRVEKLASYARPHLVQACTDSYSTLVIIHPSSPHMPHMLSRGDTYPLAAYGANDEPSICCCDSVHIGKPLKGAVLFEPARVVDQSVKATRGGHMSTTRAEMIQKEEKGEGKTHQKFRKHIEICLAPLSAYSPPSLHRSLPAPPLH